MNKQTYYKSVYYKPSISEEKFKERRSTEVEEGEIQLLLGVGSPGWQPLCLEAPKRKMLSFLSEVGVLLKDTEEDQRSFTHEKAPPQKGRAAVRVESAETEDYVSAPPLTSRMEQRMEAGNEEEMEELSFVPSAVSEPR